MSVNDYEEMFLSVNNLRFCFSLICCWFLIQPAQADSIRHVYLAPHISAQNYPLLEAEVQKHAIWRIPLRTNQVQILRLQDLRLTETRPFYRSQTRLDERSLSLTLNLKFEIWSYNQLVWQDSQQVQRQIRLLGPELQGVGIALIPRLNQQPQGALSHWPELAEPVKLAQQELIRSALEQFEKDYLNQKNRTQEKTP